MRIGINLLYLIPGLVGGTETYAAGLLSGLAQVGRHEEFVVFVNRANAEWALPLASNFERVVCPITGLHRGLRYLFEQLVLPRLLHQHAIQVVHSLGYVSPVLACCPQIVTIHDLNFRAFGKEMALVRRMTLEFFVGASARRAERVLTLSDFSRHEIINTYGLTPDRVVVTHAAPALEWSTVTPGERVLAFDRLESSSPVIVAFTSHSPNKNIPRLIEAFRLAKREAKLPHQLVLIGHPPTRLAERESGDTNVVWAGYVEPHVRGGLLASAELLVFPSTYEGFGLPVLEAMAAGVPVVCSNQASLPEVAGDAALYFDPLSVSDMAEKIAKVALDRTLQVELRRKGYENLRRFSWEMTAQQTLAVYRGSANGQWEL